MLSYNVDRDTAYAIDMRFISSLESEIRVGGHSQEIGASIGAALIPDNGTTVEEIIHNADLAMYRAKGLRPVIACILRTYLKPPTANHLGI